MIKIRIDGSIKSLTINIKFLIIIIIIINFFFIFPKLTFIIQFNLIKYNNKYN